MIEHHESMDTTRIYAKTVDKPKTDAARRGDK
jgi:hypothetical protein